jgi:hypothetical protein
MAECDKPSPGRSPSRLVSQPVDDTLQPSQAQLALLVVITHPPLPHRFISRARAQFKLEQGASGLHERCASVETSFGRQCIELRCIVWVDPWPMVAPACIEELGLL